MFKNNFKNKLVGVALILAGLVPVWLDNDGTALIVLAIVAIPMFFSEKSYFYED